jgi:hypothetical protein
VERGETHSSPLSLRQEEVVEAQEHLVKLMEGTADLVVEQEVFIVLLEQQEEQPLPQVKVTMAVLLTQQQTKKLVEAAAVLTP